MNEVIKQTLNKFGISEEEFLLAKENASFYREYKDGFILVFHVHMEWDYMVVKTLTKKWGLHILRGIKEAVKNTEVNMVTDIDGNYEEMFRFCEKFGAEVDRENNLVYWRVG